MKKDVYVIVDTAGRMAEKGKGSAEAYVFYALRHILERYNVNVQSFMWNDTIQILDENGEISDFSQKNDTDMLAEMLNEFDEGAAVLLISDGNFYNTRIKRSVISRNLHFIAVAVGEDVLLDCMDSLCTVGRAFKGEDIGSAADALCFVSD